MKKICGLLICLVMFICILPNPSIAGMGREYACGGMMHGGFMGMGHEKGEHMGDRPHRANDMSHQEHMQMMDQIMQNPSMHNELINRMMGDHRLMHQMMGQMVKDPEIMNQMMDQMMGNQTARDLMFNRMMDDPNMRSRIMQQVSPAP